MELTLSGYLLITVFILTVILIALEHHIEINKSWIALFSGSMMWIIVGASEGSHQLHDAIRRESGEIFELIIFLMGAMTVVEVLAHFRFFNWLEYHLNKLSISNRRLFWILGAVTFAGSAILDNLTTTLIIIQVGRRIYIKHENFAVFVANTVIAANAGGAMSPVGDVTTIMLWLAGKFTAWEVFLWGLAPALAAWAIPQAILTRQIQYEDRTGRVLEKEEPLKWEIIAVGFTSFGFAVLVNILHLPPFFGILFGLGAAAILIDFKLKTGRLKKRQGHITNLIQKIDLATIKFFVGILLAVGALNEAGILSQITRVTFGSNPGEFTMVAGHTMVGLVSSVMDNVPLTASVIKMLTTDINYIYWVLLAITAGTGGSVLIIGSAAGVAAMGQCPEVTFGRYARIAALPALLGYAAAVGLWYAEKSFFF